MRTRFLHSIPVLLGLFTVGCIIEVANRSEYDGCNAGDTCAGGFCQAVLITGATGNVCSYSCNPTIPRSCPNDGVCIGTGGVTGGTTGQCYRLCTGTGTCPGLSGTVCAQIDLGFGTGLTTAACIPGVSFGGRPNVTPITSLPVYAKCDPGNPTMACQSGLTCQQSAVSSVAGRPNGFTCTRACTTANECPGGTGFANCVNGYCAAVCSNPNAFDQRCAMFGTACVQTTNALTGQAVSFCAP